MSDVITYALQEQYEFIHCGLSELVVCGETEIAAANLRIAVNNLKKMTNEGMTGFQKQLQVYMYNYVLNCRYITILQEVYYAHVMSFFSTHQIIDEVSSHHPVSYVDAEQKYNSSKNRFPDKLPSE